MPSRALVLTLALGCMLAAGCRHHPWKRPAPAPCPPGGGALIPPTGIPEGAPPLPPVPRGAAPDPGSELLLPQSPPVRGRSEYPRIVPADPRGAILGSPDFIERPRVVPGDPPVDIRHAPPIEVPIGITDFIQVKDGVSAGLRPSLDGLDWLKTKGYKTVVYLRGANDDDTTDRRQVERRDMKFVSLLVTPETVNPTWIDEFNQLLGDTGSRPIFVYATDSQVAAVAWYLHLRTAEFLTHDEARVRASRLGRIDEQSELFQAAVKALSAKR
jgi:protein tyrosine phosphatase (PTP) superfamily phosphohydrolase (DUF442 family)